MRCLVIHFVKMYFDGQKIRVERKSFDVLNLFLFVFDATKYFFTFMKVFVIDTYFMLNITRD